MDYWINKMNTIQNGYNKQFMLFKDYSVLFSGNGIDKLHKMLFIKIQKHFVDKLKDDTNYKDVIGIIYKITNQKEKKSFIACSSDKTLIEAINALYDSTINKHIKSNKKYRGFDLVLTTVPFLSLKCDVLRVKKKRSKIDIEKHRDYYIKRLNTIKNGYNIDIKQVKTHFAKNQNN